jgi:uncharacterized protein (DUF1684 family)
VPRGNSGPAGVHCRPGRAPGIIRRAGLNPALLRYCNSGDRPPRAGRTSYGGGRYLLDTAKGADLGGPDGLLTIDLNFLYHPSCRYNVRWQCPPAPPGNTIAGSVCSGERLSHDTR